MNDIERQFRDAESAVTETAVDMSKATFFAWSTFFLLGAATICCCGLLFVWPYGACR